MIPALDTALKHRLTGAVILILLAVLLLPELLSGSGKAAYLAQPNSADTAEGERRIEIDLTESARPTPAAASPSAEPATVAAAAAPQVQLPVPVASPQLAPAEAAADTQAKASDTAGTAIVAPASAVKVTPAAGASPPAGASPAAGTSPPAKASAAASFFVQLGVFENVASARALERRLRARGFTVLVEPLERSGRKLHRVRVGPAADRAAADALRRRLEEAGHKGSVVQ